MDVKKKQHKQFLITYISYIATIIATISVAILSYILFQSDWAYLIIFILLLILLFASYRFKKALYLIIHRAYMEHILDDVIDPIDLRPDYDTIDVQKKLLKQGYKLHYTGNQYVILIKIVKDTQIRKIFQHHILHVAVILFDSKLKYYQTQVDDLINEIQFKSQTEDKKRIDRLLITQYKQVDEFNEKERLAINEIIFIKTDKHIVSTINVGLLKSPPIALMLASKTYRPSTYYQIHLDDIYDALK
ncbi:MAG: hypothetical protein O2987_02765 [Firmicutes bacterium]|nr:hypothetical protein [Bacillota bacterium]